MNQWFNAIKRKGELFDLSGLRVIKPAPGTYEADPFLIEKDGRTFLFFELYDYNKGVIAYRELFDDLTYTEPKVVIDESTHLSFPCLLKDEQRVFLCPERNLAGELAIYEAKEFPDKWEKIAIVSGGRFDDPVLFKRGNRYYIYATEDGEKIRIFCSDAIDGKWELIRGEDEVFSRGAGIPFEHEGKFIRPVQDGTVSYGYGIFFKGVDDGRMYHRIEPDWYPNLTGTHTFNFTDKFVVIDGRIKL